MLRDPIAGAFAMVRTRSTAPILLLLALGFTVLGLMVYGAGALFGWW